MWGLLVTQTDRKALLLKDSKIHFSLEALVHTRIQFLVMELDDVMLQSLTASTTKRCFELKHGSTKLVENVSAKDIAPRRYIFLSLVLYISFQLEDLRLINISNTAPTSNSASVCLQLGSVLLRIVEQKS